MNSFGLSTDIGTPVPLKFIDVNVKIKGYLAEVVTSLGYYNSEDDPVEAMFTFPVDDRSAVYQFEATIDGRRIVAEIQEKEHAILTYEDAKQSGMAAMLLKEDTQSSDTFQCMLGNLPAGNEAELKLSYVNELPQEEDGRVRFTLPTVLNPRFCPEAGSSVAAEGADYVPPKSVTYNFKMIVTIEGYHMIKAVSSDKISLDVKLESGGKLAQVILENGNPGKEGLLKEDMLMVSFHPDLKEVAMATSGEYVFIIDRSGSMKGNRIKNAKEALLLFLKSLPAGCYFNVVSFGSNYKCLFDKSKEYSEETLDEALQVQAKMGADMGGTEIYKPLEYVLKEKVQQQPRNVFLLTDGNVRNSQPVILLIRKHSGDTRVFALGVGSGVSTFLVNGVVRAGNGLAEFIADDERIQPKVVSLLKCAMQPPLTNIELTWDLPPGVTPVSIPTDCPVMLTVGQRLTFFAMLQGVDLDTIYATSKLTLKGQQSNNPVTFDLMFTLSEDDNSSVSAPVHRLATKTQIKLLQDEEAALCNQMNGDYYNPKINIDKVEEIRKKIVGVSRHGNIVSKFTSFVAVDTEGEKVKGELKTRRCTVPTTSEEFLKGMEMYGEDDCDGVNEDLMRGCAMKVTPQKRLRSRMTYGGGGARSAKKNKSLGLSCEKRSKPEEMDFEEDDNEKLEEEPHKLGTDREDDVDDSNDNRLRKSSSAVSSDEVMMNVITLQKLGGNWSNTTQLANLLQIPEDLLKSTDIIKDCDVLATLIVLSWLRSKYAHRQEEWQMIETKALAWLGQQNLEKPVEELLSLVADSVLHKV
ncbi:VWA5A-like protein [Mya arenaria]|uniref:VWA5A-like protein n=1 Tax=Mya arenaria TaxID=6604 RepID=A0ABY7DK31_MYAAR|nr:VWA5A-like protein [Mya arenaria]